MSGVLVDKVFGCRLWQGPLDKDGYGFHGRTRAHTKAWVDAFGPVPEDHALDHMCRRRHCIALHHLEPVTQSENEKRKSWRYRARRATCPKGHSMAMNRAITPEGGVVCRQCNREARGEEPIAALIERSSVGQGLKNIRENGIDAELADLEEEMKGRFR